MIRRRWFGVFGFEAKLKELHIVIWRELCSLEDTQVLVLRAHTIKVKLTVRMGAELPGTAREYPEYRQVGRRP